MPTFREETAPARKAMLAEIERQVDYGTPEGCRAALDLAEAIAWLYSPGESHGGGRSSEE